MSETERARALIISECSKRIDILDKSIAEKQRLLLSLEKREGCR